VGVLSRFLDVHREDLGGDGETVGQPPTGAGVFLWRRLGFHDVLVLLHITSKTAFLRRFSPIPSQLKAALAPEDASLATHPVIPQALAPR